MKTSSLGRAGLKQEDGLGFTLVLLFGWGVAVLSLIAILVLDVQWFWRSLNCYERDFFSLVHLEFGCLIGVHVVLLFWAIKGFYDDWSCYLKDKSNEKGGFVRKNER